jgi:hypothetical protein
MTETLTALQSAAAPDLAPGPAPAATLHLDREDA